LRPPQSSQKDVSISRCCPVVRHLAKDAWLAPERDDLKPRPPDQDDDSEYNESETILAMASQREIDRQSWPDRGISSKNNTPTEKRLKEMEPECPEHKNSDLKGAPESVQELAAERDDLKPRPPDQDDGRTHDESDSGPLPDESYPENWATLRRQAYKRDDYQCRNCGSKGGNRGNTELHAHHVVPRSRGGNDTLSNLVTLCSTCHRQIHEHLH
jgi:hypothetical protein